MMFMLHSQKLICLKDNFNLHQIIKSPTHNYIYKFKNSDVFLCNTHISPICSGVLHTLFSDHFIIYAVIAGNKPILLPNVVITRNYNKFVYDSFIHDLHSSDIFKSVFKCNDVFHARST